MITRQALTDSFSGGREQSCRTCGQGASVLEYAVRSTMEQADPLNKRITNVVELMNRLTPATPDAVFISKPLVATAIELGDENALPESRLWAIVHSITDYQLQFIHGQPIRAEKIALRISSGGGEVVEIVVATSGSQPIGDLYETSARFFQADPPSTPEMERLS